MNFCHLEFCDNKNQKPSWWYPNRKFVQRKENQILPAFQKFLSKKILALGHKLC